jgi:nitrate/nitrite transporter NarK
MTSIETCFARNLTRDVRGTMRGVETLCGSIGGLFFTKVGGYMFDVYGSKSPFLMFSMVNLTFAIAVSIAALSGKVKH